MKRSVQDIVCDVLVGVGLVAVIGLGSASLWYDAQVSTSDEEAQEGLLPPLDEDWEETADDFTDEAVELTPMQEVPMIEDKPQVEEEVSDTALSRIQSDKVSDTTRVHHATSSTSASSQDSDTSSSSAKSSTSSEAEESQQHHEPVKHTMPVSRDTLSH